MAINTWPSSPASNSHRGASFVETVLLNVPCATKSLPLHQSVSWMGLYHTPLSLQTLALESASEMALHHKRVLIAVSKVKIMLQWANNSTFFPPELLCLGAQIPCHRYGDRAAIGACVTHTVLLLILQVKICDMSNWFFRQDCLASPKYKLKPGFWSNVPLKSPSKEE